MPEFWNALYARNNGDTSGDDSESTHSAQGPVEEQLRIILKNWQYQHHDWNGHDILKVALQLLLEDRTAGRVPPQNIAIMCTLVAKILKEVADSTHKLRQVEWTAHMDQQIWQQH